MLQSSWGKIIPVVTQEVHAAGWLRHTSSAFSYCHFDQLFFHALPLSRFQESPFHSFSFPQLPPIRKKQQRVKDFNVTTLGAKRGPKEKTLAFLVRRSTVASTSPLSTGAVPLGTVAAPLASEGVLLAALSFALSLWGRLGSCFLYWLYDRGQNLLACLRALGLH